MDRIDLDIIALLQKDGRRPFTEIADKLGISEGTVRNRVSRLTTSQVLQIVGMADPSYLGYEASAIIGVRVEPPRLTEIAGLLANLSDVSYLIMVSGDFDLFVEVMCQNREQLASFLNEKLLTIPGILRTETFFILRTYKLAYGAVPTLPLHGQLELSTSIEKIE